MSIQATSSNHYTSLAPMDVETQLAAVMLESSHETEKIDEQQRITDMATYKSEGEEQLDAMKHAAWMNFGAGMVGGVGTAVGGAEHVKGYEVQASSLHGAAEMGKSVGQLGGQMYTLGEKDHEMKAGAAKLSAEAHAKHANEEHGFRDTTLEQIKQLQQTKAQIDLVIVRG